MVVGQAGRSPFRLPRAGERDRREEGITAVRPGRVVAAADKAEWVAAQALRKSRMRDTLSPRSLPRLEDQRFLTGSGRYTADLHREGQLHMTVVRSEHAHAAIADIDIGDALTAPGVVGVHTAADLAADGVAPLPCLAELAGGAPPVVPPRHALARGRVRHVGDPVAIVVAESEDAALEAAEQVVVDYRALPAVVDPARALEDGAPQLWEQAPGNLAFRYRRGDADAVHEAFASAAHVVELAIANPRVSAAPLEPRAGLAEYDTDGDRFTLTATAQGVHEIRDQAAGVLGIEPERLRLLAPDVGGGFGLKNFLYPEWILLPWAARRHRRPVRWVATRGEDLAAAAHGRDVQATARLALDADGRFLALEASLVANMGAYLSGSAPNVTTKALPTAFGGIYAIPAVHLSIRGVFTNTAPVDAYRGAGKPEANFIVERLIDVAARRYGFDPVALRRKNALRDFPHRTAFGMTVDGGRFATNIDRAMALCGWDEFAARRTRAASRHRLRGLGVACFLETARGMPREGAEIRFAGDGTVELRVGTESHGQGHETAFAQIAAARLGLPVEAFRFVQADTTRTRTGHGHGGARSMHMGGAALCAAVDSVLAKAHPVAARLLQTDASQVTFGAGCFQVSGSAPRVGLLEVASAAREMAPAGNAGLDSFATVEDAPFTFPNGCHVAEVEIDLETGVVRLLRYLCVDDYGALVNPMLAEGQVHGGVAQGIGQALTERTVYDTDSGQLLSGSLMDYALPAADGLPSLEVHLEGTPTHANPLGVKGTGQAGAIAAPQAVMNAVLDALSPLGIEHLDLPATSERVWRAIREARTR
jgi:carbon-monoxide dehydrogenase large subunit